MTPDEMNPAAIAPAAVLGLAIGSFLNVVAWRVPRGESLVRPGSHCPGCGAPVKPWDNVPLLSWLLLRGRCRGCGERISVRYPLVELGTALLYVALVLALWGDWRRLTLALTLVTFLVPITAIDLDVRRIPNVLTATAALLAIALGLGFGLGAGDWFLPAHLLAAAIAGLFFFLPALISRKGMGMGDVKLAGVLGLYLGAPVGPAILIGLLAGTVVGIAIIARRGVSTGRKTAIPFGPFLALGAVVCLFAGPELLDAYTGTFR